MDARARRGVAITHSAVASRGRTTVQSRTKRTFDLLLQSNVTSAESLAIDEAWQHAFAANATDAHPLLRVYALPGELLSLGRFHALRQPLANATPVHRRLSGGRNVPFGSGFFGISLVLPHRSALVSDDPHALGPTQILNRCVRGLLSGLKSIGIPAFYPGLDFVTVDRRIIAMLSFHVAASGALLFEAVLAVARNFAPAGDSVATMAQLGPDELTTVREQLGVEPTLQEIGEVLARGYAEQFELSFVAIQQPPAFLTDAISQLTTTTFEPRSWSAARLIPRRLDHCGSTTALLGRLEAYYSLTSSKNLGEVWLCGDFIANAMAIDLLESSLQGCALEPSAISEVARRSFAHGDNFILGLSSLSSIADAICDGLTS